ncbi:hypothetical protein [Encephalitozoon cuniculi GB-M1]|uniref:Uncharacterized protein n=1 Tax=Encephalitozoon cuniculi (strain GB-M1) TaxID=284813 RepID=Q8SUF2_ENCCU|nr:uncharacterized protein ECU10_0770 [Encephalitozoon cuniculi GB-M1]CAD25796.2 hypothetical protein [Encephalitozoon cuniculi GB-M1]
MSTPAQADIPQEYINNENPFAYMSGYFENPFLDPEVRLQLNALQQIQPKFIPLGINGRILKTEQAAKTKAIAESQIEKLLDKGMELVGSTDLPREDALRNNADNPEVLDILISINRLRLLSNQERLREKVYCVLKNMIPSDMVSSIDYSSSIDEDYLSDAMEYEELERKSAQAKMPASARD